MLACSRRLRVIEGTRFFICGAGGLRVHHGQLVACHSTPAVFQGGRPKQAVYSVCMNKARGFRVTPDFNMLVSSRLKEAGQGNLCSTATTLPDSSDI